jgi:phi13 family phage major tail protein
MASFVTTGFSLPYVALYSAVGGTVTYSSGIKLARGVSVSVDANVVDDNDFYADNVLAETESGQVSGGTLTLTVDGLDMAARRKIFGLPAAASSGAYSGWTAFGDQATMPFVGVGFIRRVMYQGTTYYQAVLFPKCKFAYDGEDAATQEDQISWQTRELTASFMRDDTANHNWKYVNETQFTSESAAETALKALMSIT